MLTLRARVDQEAKAMKIIHYWLHRNNVQIDTRDRKGRRTNNGSKVYKEEIVIKWRNKHGK